MYFNFKIKTRKILLMLPPKFRNKDIRFGLVNFQFEIEIKVYFLFSLIDIQFNHSLKIDFDKFLEFFEINIEQQPGNTRLLIYAYTYNTW